MPEIVYNTPLRTFIDFVKIIIAALFIAILIRSFKRGGQFSLKSKDRLFSAFSCRLLIVP